MVKELAYLLFLYTIQCTRYCNFLFEKEINMRLDLQIVRFLYNVCTHDILYIVFKVDTNTYINNVEIRI